MIEIRGLKKAFGGNAVLNGIDLDIQKGEIVTIIGLSGAGKTTLLRTLNWLEVPDEGTISISGASIDAGTATKKQIAALRSKSAMVFQHYDLFADRTALENVTESLICVRKMNRREARDRGLALLDRVGLLDKADVYPAFSPADSSSGWVSPGLWPWSRRSSSLMSPPAPWILSG